MEVAVSDDYRERGIDVVLGVLEFEVPSIGEGRLASRLEGLAEKLAPGFDAIKPAEVPEIAATRKAYRALGKDPSRYRPSSEALMRRIASGKPMPIINDIVDAGNVISLTTRLAIGAYNTDAIRGLVTFRRAGDGETAQAIGRGEMNFEHLPVFADDMGPFGSPTSDTERTMVKPETRNILMILIGFGSCPEMNSSLAMADELLRTCCKAKAISTSVVSNITS